MHYNVCILQPQGYVHAMAFWELGEGLRHAIQELGHTSSIGVNSVFHDTANIVIGCHLLDPAQMAAFPPSTIILNVEQVGADGTPWSSRIVEWAQRFETWDYSERNLAYLRAMGASGAKLLQLGLQKELSRITPCPAPDIDVLFYGSMNPRRARILEGLDARGMAVKHLFGVYGQERDEHISRSRVVLNLHMYETQIFEIVRVSYLLANAVAVIAEVNPGTAVDAICIAGVCATPYDGLVEACVRHVKDDALRLALGRRGYEVLARHPQAALVRPLLQTA